MEDFGFSLVNEEDILKDYPIQENNKKAMLKLEKFFNKLIGDGGDVIKWPYEQRKESINNFMSEIGSLLLDSMD